MEGTGLTPNAASALWAGNTDFKPVLQCTDLKMLQPASGKQGATVRYRVHLSDGKHFMQAMLATQTVEKVNNGDFATGSIVRLDEFLCNTVHNRKIVIVLQSTTLGKQPIVGNPTNVADRNAQEPHSRAPVGAPKQQQYGAGYGSELAGMRREKENVYQQPNPPQAPYQQQMPSRNSGGYKSEQGGFQGGPGGPPGASGNNYQRQGGYGGSTNANRGGPGPGMGRNYQQQQQQGGMGGYQSRSYPPHGGGGGYNQPAADYRSRGPISRNEAPARIVPIKSLNPYLNRWTIQARVTNKSDVRKWQNAKGEGSVFNFDVVDVDGGEIRLCAFKEACEKFHPLVEVGKVYMISKGALRPARKQYNNLNSDFEVYLETNSTIEPCVEDERTSTIPSITFDFKPIISLENVNTGSLADVVGVVLSVDACATIQRRDGTDTQKRTLTIKDDSNASIEVTLWGNYCNEPGNELELASQQGSHPVLAVKNARVGDYQGKTLGTISSTQLLVNPDIPEAGRLRNWYDRMGGAHSQTVQLNTGGGGRTRRVFLSDIRDENLGTSGKADYVEVLATVKYIKNEVMSYPACSLQRNGRQCNKKVAITDDDQDGLGSGWCETCQQKCQVNWRWMIQFEASDFTEDRWLTCFGDVGNDIMGMTANDFKKYEGSADFDHILTKAHFKRWLLTLKVAEDTYNDEKRVKVTVQRVNQVDWAKESKAKMEQVLSALDSSGGHVNNNAERYGNEQKKPRTEYGYQNQGMNQNMGYNNNNNNAFFR
ncbi:replication factor A protein 1 [Chloropicon primus]|uniref:Replication protein A subunit n=1 Tax=Chloropicon primus TaxID=1764295 RepID=A0A5B8MP46_9CHLO|nr:replication factor A protein 1 [Chloropicon primus]UPR01300.1 replication factor A protein 1 [Chloropicon primus]|eukprot:QDZ22081.1 replication factor A protein 1 [Chloropicon primus]